MAKNVIWERLAPIPIKYEDSSSNTNPAASCFIVRETNRMAVREMLMIVLPAMIMLIYLNLLLRMW